MNRPYATTALALEALLVAKGLTAVLGDLVSEAEQCLVFRLCAPAIAEAGSVLLASVTVAYDAVANGIHAREVTQDLRLRVVSVEQAVAVTADAAVTRELLVLRAARVLGVAIAQADAGDVAGGLQRLKDFPVIPEIANSTDPEVRAARKRIKDFLHDLEERGYNRNQRKQMHYSSYRWTRGKGKPSQEPTEDGA